MVVVPWALDTDSWGGSIARVLSRQDARWQDFHISNWGIQRGVQQVRYVQICLFGEKRGEFSIILVALSVCYRWTRGTWKMDSIKCEQGIIHLRSAFEGAPLRMFSYLYSSCNTVGALAPTIPEDKHKSPNSQIWPFSLWNDHHSQNRI